MGLIKLYVKHINESVEKCYYIENKNTLSVAHLQIISNLLTKNDANYQLSSQSLLDSNQSQNIFEIGPKLNYDTPWCSNALHILNKIGISISKIEFSIRYIDKNISYDKLTHQEYNDINSIYSKSEIEKPYIIPIDILKSYGLSNGLSFDNDDIQFYTHLFRNVLNRDPKNIEIFDLSQSNSEHSRHWLFNGELIYKNKTLPDSLFNMIKSTNLDIPNNNSLVAFKDNASSIKGNMIHIMKPTKNFKHSFYDLHLEPYDLTLNAETHNFPTGICPFPGAATGVGGRIRDTLSIGRGGNMIAGVSGYCVGNLYLEDYDLSWENYYPNQDKIGKLGKDILIEASNGASDYGNKIGEPNILGFTRSFGMNLKNERIEWIKPIMFSGGIGQISRHNLEKQDSQANLLIIRVGGPGYPVGLGGGSASSRSQSKDNYELDYSAVQRGDPEMANKLFRFVRSCSELKHNPILSIHDQGSGPGVGPQRRPGRLDINVGQRSFCASPSHALKAVLGTALSSVD